MTFSLNAFEELVKALGFTLHEEPHDSRTNFWMGSLAMGIYRDLACTLEAWPAALRYTTKVVLPEPLPMRVRISPVGWASQLAEAVGLKEAQLGHEGFRIETDDVERLGRLLTPAVNAALVAMREQNSSFVLTEKSVEAERHFVLGTPLSVEDGKRDLDPCVELVLALSAAARA